MDMTMIMNISENGLTNFQGLNLPVNKNFENELQDFYKYLVSIVDSTNKTLNTSEDISDRWDQASLNQEVDGELINKERDLNEDILTGISDIISMAVNPDVLVVKEMDNLQMDKFKIMFRGQLGDTKIKYNFISQLKDNPSIISQLDSDKKSNDKQIDLFEGELAKIGFISKTGDSEFFKSLYAVKDTEALESRIDGSKVISPVALEIPDVDKDLKSIDSDIKDLSVIKDVNLDITQTSKGSDKQEPLESNKDTLKIKDLTFKDLEIQIYRDDVKDNRSTLSETLEAKEISLNKNDSEGVKKIPDVNKKDQLTDSILGGKELVSNYVLKTDDKQTERDVTESFNKTFVDRNVKESFQLIYKINKKVTAESGVIEASNHSNAKNYLVNEEGINASKDYIFKVLGEEAGEEVEGTVFHKTGEVILSKEPFEFVDNTASEEEFKSKDKMRIERDLSVDGLIVEGKKEIVKTHEIQEKPTAEKIIPLDNNKDVHIIDKDRHSLEVSVEPEGLGRLDIKLMLDNDSIKAKIVTFDQGSKEVIDGNILNIIDSLIKEGLNVSGFSVSLRQRRQEPYYFKESRDEANLSTNKNDLIKKHQEGIINIFI
jgi:hypothetical protein